MSNSDKINNQESIVLLTDKNGISIFENSKQIIQEVSAIIDTNIETIKYINIVINQTANIEINKKEEFLDFQKSQIDFLEIYCFLLNFQIDISISSRELVLARSRPEQIYYIKNIYIELYRYLERHNKDLGKIRTLCESSFEYKDYNSKLIGFRKKYYSKIKEERNIYYAHFDSESNYKEYYDYILKIDIDKTIKMCSEFLSVHEKLTLIFKQLSDNIFEKSIQMNNILKQKNEDIKNEIINRLEELRALSSENIDLETKMKVEKLYEKFKL